MDTTIDINIPEKLIPLFDPWRYKAIYGGRGTAKSHSAASALLAMGMDKPLRILCAREIQLSIKDSVKQLLEDKIEAYGMGEFYSVTRDEIKGANGTLFIFSGLGKMTIDQMKSKEGIDIVWVEEAQTISAKSIEILGPTLRQKGSELWFTWNPRNASDPVDQLFRGEIVPEDALIIRMDPKDNPFFPDELSALMEFDKMHKPERFAHIWLGEYEPMAIGAIWNRLVIHQNRRREAPEMGRILVGIDPAISAEAGSNENGIIVGGLGSDGRGYILDDMTTIGAPMKWANRAISAFDKWDADAIVIEINQGGNMCRQTLETVRPGLPIIEVHASRGKHVRAEPISALYEAGQISHIGTFDALENQMCQMTAAGFEGEGSPDRVDAMVWVFTELFPKIIRKQEYKEVEYAVGFDGSWMG